MATSFNELGLNLNLIEGLKKAGLTEPTDIQLTSIPLALDNKNIIGQSQTGSGKTLAYLLPIFEKIDSSKREMQSIILAPTHELVMQINNEIKILATNSELPITSTTIIGEVNMKRQIENLKKKPHIIVGSPGRIIELIKKRKISAHTVRTLVIDEGDKLLDKNNLATVKSIIKTTLRDTQLMVFSATINKKTLDVAKDFISNAEVIKVKNEPLVTENITHMYFTCEHRDKIETLRKLLASIKPKKAIVFLNSGETIDVTTSKLQYNHINAYSIYGKTSKEDRKKAIEGFRLGKFEILISSDVAARGLDIKGVTHILNLDLPKDSKEYLHRSGRTGRSGNLGTSISIVSEKELSLLKNYEKIFNIEFESKKIYKGKILNTKKTI